jgi:AAA domain
VLELIRLFFCRHVHPLRESASIVFGGGFPRNEGVTGRQAAQRAIFHVQRELEATHAQANAAVVLCDRGTLDGSAYWLGAGTLWESLGVSREAELTRYHTVIHLRTPTEPAAYEHENPLRIESQAEARAIDDRIAEAWRGHPRMFQVPASPDFLSKAARALEVLRDTVPACCRDGVQPFLWRAADGVSA